jgi:hypothetical protein
MATANEIVAYLAGQSPTLGAAGSTLFIDDMPADPDVCGAVFYTGGQAPDLGFGVDGVQFENVTLQIRFRGAAGDSNGPRVKAQQAFEALAKIQAPDTLSGTKYLTAIPLQPPFILDRDDQGHRVVWAFNVLIKKELSV